MGFWSNTTLIAIILLVFALKLCSVNANFFGIVITVIYIVGWIVWVAIGSIWRFSDPGRVAAGERLIHEADIDDDLWEKQL